MSKTIAQETEEDQKSYEKLQCWCDAEKKEKAETLDQGSAKIAEIESSLDSLAASRATLETHIKDLQQQVAEGQKASEQAAAVRKDQKEKFDSYEADTETYLVSLKAAIGVLTKKTGQTALPQTTAFMQMFSRAPLMPESRREQPQAEAYDSVPVDSGDSRVSGLDEVDLGAETERRLRGSADALGGPRVEGWSPEEEAAVNRGLGAAMSFAQSAQGKSLELYSPGSTGELIGMFQQMLSTMEGDLKDARVKEAQSVRDFQELQEARREELREATSMVDLKKRERAHASEALALAKSDKKQLSKVLATSREALATVAKRCQDSERGFKDRREARHQEDAAILETIQVLTDGGSSATSFLQLTMASRAQTRARSVASDTLRAAAARGTAEGRVSRSLEGLAAAAESESFGKVREAIDGMIRELKMQQSTDAKKKDWCKLELFEIQKATEAASDHQTSLNLRSSQMEQDIKALQGDLDHTAAKRSELQGQLQAASEERREEQTAFQKTHWDQQMTLRALQQAFRKLSGVYAPPLSFLARQPRQAAGYQKNLMGGTVLKLLQTLMADAKGLVEKAATAENQAEASYGRFVEETKTMLEALQADVVAKSRAIATAKKDLLRTGQDARVNAQERTDLAAQKANLKAQCDSLIKDFGQISDKRQAEIEALTQSKAALVD
ncbi:unnamed protein product [Symbiodinium natans]|uniref:Uncharacterized protein n=1 Tax=Symbiodinium natans TaxID=878477 RepID=A0A812PBC2_9DINO|nr:unnamed protein product [Symbiodinium natans]